MAEAQLWQKALLGTASGPEVLYKPVDRQNCVKGTLTSSTLQDEMRGGKMVRSWDQVGAHTAAEDLLDRSLID